jgi:hypothetical protein
MSIDTKTMLAAAVVVAACAGERTAAAQATRGYVGGAGLVSIQDAHRQGSAPSLPITGGSGAAAGVFAEAGGLLTPRVALGAELSLPARYTSLQETRYFRVFQHESRHRDLAVSGIVRFVAVSTERFRWGIVGGGGFVQESTEQRRRDEIGPLPTTPPVVFGPWSEEDTFTRWTTGLVAGSDAEIAMSAHVALVPEMRVHFVRRSGDPSEPGWFLGLSSIVYRPAVGVRAAF